jgi:hypothetical protein
MLAGKGVWVPLIGKTSTLDHLLPENIDHSLPALKP